MKNLLTLSAIIMGLSCTKANNLVLSNMSIPDNQHIVFDIVWNNSWNIGGVNYDGVWVFVKVQDCGVAGTPWTHAGMSVTSSDHVASLGVLSIDAVTDGKGVFIKRGSVGQGTLGVTSVTLKFSSTYVLAQTNFQVFGIEMVNIPQEGNFQVGDG